MQIKKMKNKWSWNRYERQYIPYDEGLKLCNFYSNYVKDLSVTFSTDNTDNKTLCSDNTILKFCHNYEENI
jgi:hypothetical protein